MKSPTCEELGFCQALAECPQGSVTSLSECHVACSAPAQTNYPFAPGVIDGLEHGEPLGRMETLGCWLAILSSLGGLVALFGIAIGYFNLPEWLL